jgi:hypothetical protein
MPTADSRWFKHVFVKIKMAVYGCRSNEEIPRVANLTELEFHENYFLKVIFVLFINLFTNSLNAVKKSKQLWRRIFPKV